MTLTHRHKTHIRTGAQAHRHKPWAGRYLDFQPLQVFQLHPRAVKVFWCFPEAVVPQQRGAAGPQPQGQQEPFRGFLSQLQRDVYVLLHGAHDQIIYPKAPQRCSSDVPRRLTVMG